MVGLGMHGCTWSEAAVVLFQVVGVVALCVNRLGPVGRLSARGRDGFVVALVGLGVAGAFCGREDSEFALFAGVTMTLLLIGMTLGSAQGHTTSRPHGLAASEA